MVILLIILACFFAICERSFSITSATILVASKNFTQLKTKHNQTWAFPKSMTPTVLTIQNLFRGTSRKSV
jgi:hypothetical protein